MLLSMMASWGLAADVATLQPPIPQPQAPATWPSGLTIGAGDTTCEFTTILPPGSDTVQVVHLEEVAVDGSLIALRGVMRDDGQSPDLQVGDGVFSLRLQLKPDAQPSLRRFRSTVRLRDGHALMSPLTVLPTLPFPCEFMTPGPDHLIRDPVTREEFFDHQLLFTVDAQATLADIQAIVALVPGARMVGSSPALRCYQMEITPTGGARVRAAIAVTATAPHVVGAEVHGVTRVNEASVPGATPARKPTRK